MLFQLLFQAPQFSQKIYSREQTLELFSKLKFEPGADGSNTFLVVFGKGKVCAVKHDSKSDEPYTLTHSAPNYLTGAIERTSYKFSSDGKPVGVLKSKIFPSDASADEIGNYSPLLAANTRELNSAIEVLEKNSGVRSPLQFPPRKNS